MQTALMGYAGLGVIRQPVPDLPRTQTLLLDFTPWLLLTAED